jgi:hypothetical protein
MTSAGGDDRSLRQRRRATLDGIGKPLMGNAESSIMDGQGLTGPRASHYGML